MKTEIKSVITLTLEESNTIKKVDDYLSHIQDFMEENDLEYYSEDNVYFNYDEIIQAENLLDELLDLGIE